jgi:hypothetical protein
MRSGAQVAAQVPDQVGQDEAVGEAPGAVHACERIMVAADDDRLQRKVRSGLEDGEVRSRRGAIGTAQLDDQVGHDVARARATVVEDDCVVEAPHRGRTVQRLSPRTRAPRRMREEGGDAVEITGVDPFGVGHDEGGDRFQVGQHTADRAPIPGRAASVGELYEPAQWLWSTGGPHRLSAVRPASGRATCATQTPVPGGRGVNSVNSWTVPFSSRPNMNAT